MEKRSSSEFPGIWSPVLWRRFQDQPPLRSGIDQGWQRVLTLSKLQDHSRDVYVQNNIFMHFFCWKGFPCRYWTRRNGEFGWMPLQQLQQLHLFEPHSSISLPQKLETCLVSGNDVRFERKQRMEALDYWHFTVLCLSLVVKNAMCLDVLVTSVHPCHFARCEPGRVLCAVVMSQGSSPVTICWSRCITRQHGRVGLRWLKEGLMKTWKHETCSKLMQSIQPRRSIIGL